MQYPVSGLKCPVILANDNGENHERCNADVTVELWVNQHTPSGRSSIHNSRSLFARGQWDTSCAYGHNLSEMAHDMALDLDGIPVVP